MSRSRSSLVQKVVCAGVVAVAVLLAAPLQLAAQQGELSHAQATGLEWAASAWSGLTAWFASVVDGRCAVDPNGCPAAAAPQTPPSSVVDGRCDVDPNGCPGGA